ncbi:MAG: formylmethanofuran dehydrogenase subunit A [Methylicorpusculum sp.]|uniref:formylmethanofuran dehydrogenase subunit A n=1 Tax=Methylicorpusculum sp. TaxID=2713644 RepID=UPI00272813AA|nr:formylmethanofuran dehydrogenase subunit A [Methylicorpusculum sp.]MDO8844366.1 formylmethanofuran dehydrogenase subunit A [Methylicorpusculum sp.]MDO8940673.1 formylmethanofuran dehydrogenase subunit A [Methylicorpusculum sp.]MDP2202698.1 formylmethanofuran dehydrogenase subunit A [Methylicorpusculum sp.]
MLIRLKGGRIYDPAQKQEGVVSDIYIRDGVIVNHPESASLADVEYDITGKVVMAGAIDIHSHIAGGNVNTARLLLPEQHRNFLARKLNHPFSTARWSATETGYRYALMGYTTVVEPAVLPINALDAHLQMADIPIIDTAGLAILGNDDYLLRLLRTGVAQNQINDYVAWTLHATRCLGLKVINAGGANAFKSNARSFDLDDQVPEYGVSSRHILQTLQRAACEIQLPHPVHVHCNNLGIPGNVDTALATMEAAQGLPMHLAHIQFYGYGNEGNRGFSTAAAKLIDGFKKHPNITMDVGQVLFAQTVTISGDVIAQYSRRHDASPNKWVALDAECEGSGGVVPYCYKESSFVNSLQWLIGLEIFLLAEDPWRLFFTTDHPNGGPFTMYPFLIRLLMDKDYRLECMAQLNQEAVAMSLLKDLHKEFTLYDIAIMTRTAAAQLLGLADRGHLMPGAVADIAVYTEQADKAAMFGHAALVFKNGHLVVKDGEIVGRRNGTAQIVQPEFDKQIERRLQLYYDQFYNLKLDSFAVADVSFNQSDNERFIRHSCGTPYLASHS